MKRPERDDPQVPAAPLRDRLGTALLLEGRRALSERYGRRFAIAPRSADRHISQVLGSESVSLFLADAFLTFLGSHLEIAYPELRTVELAVAS